MGLLSLIAITLFDLASKAFNSRHFPLNLLRCNWTGRYLVFRHQIKDIVAGNAEQFSGLALADADLA